MKYARTIVSAFIAAMAAASANAADAAIWCAGLNAGVVDGASTLNESDFPDDAHMLADPVMGPVATTVRVTNAGNVQAADPLGTIWTKNRTWVYWGEMWFDGKAYRFASWMQDGLLVKVDGREVLRQTATDRPSTSGLLMPTRGWHSIEIRCFNNGDATAGPRNSSDTYKGWDSTHGFGIATEGASGNSYLGFEYPYPADTGTGSIFRHDGGAGAISDVTYDHSIRHESHSIAASSDGQGTVSPQNTVCADDESVNVVATPGSSCRFVRWEGDVAEGQTFAADVMVPGNRDRSIRAVFEEISARTAKTYSGASNGKWNVDGNWNPAGVPGPNDDVTIPTGKNVELDIYADIGSLTLQGSACLSANFASGYLAKRSRDAGNTASTSTIGLDVRGDLTMQGTSKLFIGGYKQAGASRLAVKGNLSLDGTACELAVYAGPTNGVDRSYQAFQRGGARVVVGGRTHVSPGCWIYPYSHNWTSCGSTADSARYNTGNPVVFDLRDLEVDAGGGFNADGLGYAKRYCDAPLCSHTLNSYVVPNNVEAGGGYGGRGGCNSNTSYEGGFRAYGYPMAPFYPGIAGGGEGVIGGGAIRIYADFVTLNGTLTAKSSTGDHNLGSGGGIWVTCTWLFGLDGILSADSRYHTSKYYTIGDYGTPRSGGGGGRIAVGAMLSAYDVDCLYARGATDSYVDGSIADIFGPGVATASAKATSGFYRTQYADGEDGTVVAYASADPSTCSLLVLMPEGFAPDPDFVPGFISLEPGSDLSDDEFYCKVAPEMLVSADGTHRVSCSGYRITSTAGNAVGVGNEIVTPYVVMADAELEWLYGDDEYKADCSAIGDDLANVSCAWTDEGEEMTITATAGTAGKEFQYWLGDVPFEKRFENPIVVPAQSAFSAVAFFGNTAEEAKVYTSRDADSIEWFKTTDWTPNGIPGTNDTARVVGIGNSRGMVAPAYVAVKDLVVEKCYCFIGGTRGLFNNKTSLSRDGVTSTSLPRHCAYDPERLEPIGMDVFGDVFVSTNGCLYFGGMDQNSPLKVMIRGDLSVAGGFVVPTAGYDLHEIPAYNVPEFIEIPPLDLLYGKNIFEVQGKTTIHPNGWMRPICDNRTGAPVRFVMAEVEVAEGGGFDAREGGYERSFFLGTRRYRSCPGGMADGDNKQGGSHAGLGGGAGVGTKATYIVAYGFENAPVYPGSASGTNRDGFRGAGTIRIDADTLLLNGSLVTVPSMPGQKGAAAGGAVFVNVGTFTPGENCSVSVSGGPGKDGSGGGAGRAAICLNLTPSQMTNLVISADHTAENAMITPLADYIGNRFTCAGGQASSTAKYSDGESGTGVYIVNTSGNNALTIAGNPGNYGAVSPSYGLATFQSGSTVEAAAPEFALISDDGLSRLLNAGWVLTDVGGNQLDSGAGTNCTFTIAENATLTWQWSTLQHAVSVTATEGGAIVTNAIGNASSIWQNDASSVSLGAAPSSGYAFVGWYGDVPQDKRFDQTLEFVAERGRSVVAVYAPAAAGDRVWYGSGTTEAPGGDGRSWNDPANWQPAGLPGVNESVSIPAGAHVESLDGFPVEVGSLTVAQGASLTVRNSEFNTNVQMPNEAVESDFYPSVVKVNGDLVVSGALDVGRRHSMSESSLTVAGSLVVNSNGVLSVYAGWKDLDWHSKTGWWLGGGTVRVGGTAKVMNGGRIEPWCNGLSGAPVVFRLGRLVVEAGGRIDAVSKGWDYSLMGSAQTIVQQGPGIQSENNYAGATHAGRGGGSSNGHTSPTTTYGDPLAPYMPGCTARITSYPANGGGAIRIIASGAVRCDGAIDADGGSTYSTDSGGGSGGGLWISCESMRIGDTASVTARGGCTYRNPTLQSGGNSGAGGGGRVCICEHLSESEMREFFETGATTSQNVVVEDLSDAAAYSRHVGNGVVSAAGGEVLAGATGHAGQDGTVRWVSGVKGTLLFMVK